MIHVSILGATGRMGALAKQLVDADSNLKLHSALDSSSPKEQMLGADVVIDFTNPSVSESLVLFAIKNSLKIVVGTSGWSELKLAGLEKALKTNLESAVVVVPNFSIGSMLAQRFAAMSAKYFDSIEILEAHHEQKVDSPSGTAIRTAELIADARKGMPQQLISGVGQAARGAVHAGVAIHSLRQKGISAKQDTIFGADGEQLVISHDVSSSRAYSLGILRSIEFAQTATGLTVGLENVLEK
jgi:4-hydroxy-tetrahydrodipicolinate reductase